MTSITIAITLHGRARLLNVHCVLWTVLFLFACSAFSPKLHVCEQINKLDHTVRPKLPNLNTKADEKTNKFITPDRFTVLQFWKHLLLNGTCELQHFCWLERKSILTCSGSTGRKAKTPRPGVLNRRPFHTEKSKSETVLWSTDRALD